MKEFFVVFLILLLSNLAYAKTPIEIVTTDEAPFQMQVGENQFTGISYEILELLLKETGYAGTEVKFMPWARAYLSAQKKPNTLIFSISRNAQREALFNWVIPLFENANEVWRLKSRTDIKVNSLEDIDKYKLGLWRDDVRHVYFKSKGFTQFQLVTSDKQNILKLLKGRIDLYIANSRPVFKNNMMHWGLENHLLEMEPVYRLEDTASTLYIAFSLGTEQSIMDDFSNALTKIKKTEQYKDLLIKYGF